MNTSHLTNIIPIPIRKFQNSRTIPIPIRTEVGFVNLFLFLFAGKITIRWSVVLKKNINTPQFARLERRAEDVKVETEKHQNLAANANIEAEKAPTET